MKSIIETKEQYLNAISAWKNTCKDKDFQFSAEHFALYAIIRGKDPKECFASPEQQSKRKLLCQGKTGNEAYDHAMSMIKSGYSDAYLLAPFQGTITKLDLMKIRNHWKDEEFKAQQERDDEAIQNNKLLMLGVA